MGVKISIDNNTMTAENNRYEQIREIKTIGVSITLTVEKYRYR